MQNNENLSDYGEFKMSGALTGYRIKYRIKVEPLLLKIPFARQNGSEPLLNSDGWNTFTGEMMREY